VNDISWMKANWFKQYHAHKKRHKNPGDLDLSSVNFTFNSLLWVLSKFHGIKKLSDSCAARIWCREGHISWTLLPSLFSPFPSLYFFFLFLPFFLPLSFLLLSFSSLFPVEVGPFKSSQGVRRSAVSYPSGIWGGAPDEIEIEIEIELAKLHRHKRAHMPAAETVRRESQSGSGALNRVHLWQNFWGFRGFLVPLVSCATVSDDAENSTAVVSVGSNNLKISITRVLSTLTKIRIFPAISMFAVDSMFLTLWRLLYFFTSLFTSISKRLESKFLDTVFTTQSSGAVWDLYVAWESSCLGFIVKTLIAMWGMYEHCAYIFCCRILCIFFFFLNSYLPVMVNKDFQKIRREFV